MVTPRQFAASSLVALAMTVFAAAPSNAQVISGEARALDGDSLTVSGREVRLFGIDAPEHGQTCQKDGNAWACGESAKEQLSALVAGQRVDCRGQGVDQFGRILAVCSVGRDQLNQIMVQLGWAVAFRQFSDDYVAAELEAKTNRLGIWSSTFQMPSDFRHASEPPARITTPVPAPRRRASTQPPLWSGGCSIKGNQNRRGEWIYHLPGMPYYDQTRAEQIFCTEAQAQAAGYRRAIVRP